ncbi:MAG: DUF169 domain-containing protein [Chloroflexi bacterium]|nr:DUF169 domain-containing protein [Chloroflexota bacterium]
MGHAELTELFLEKLQLELPPVALTFVEQPPPDVLVMGKEAPSFCTLWRWGENATFFASAEQHLGCLVGGMVSGYALKGEQLEEVTLLLDELCPADDLPPDKIEEVPKVEKRHAGAVYGPLWSCALEPDLVLVWANIVQVAVLQEVSSPVMWRGNPQGGVFPRPACSVLATALSFQKPAYSLGCVGMRAYTQVPPELSLLAIPGSALGQLEQGLRSIEDPQARMQVYYDRIHAAQQAQQGQGAHHG